MTQSHHELNELIASCFQNPQDVETLTRLHEAFRPYVIVILVSIAPDGSGLAEDAYQAAFIKYIEIFKSGRKPQNAVPYFIAIAKNCLIDELRRLQPYVPFDELIDEDFSAKNLDDTNRRDARMALLKGMSSLNQRCRFLLEQYYLKGTDIPQLAKYLKIQQDSVYVLLQRCRKELKNLLLQC